MFTFGREREREYAARKVRNPQQIPLIHDAVDAVHDFLEKRIELDVAKAAVCRAFVEGGSGVWEQAGWWLRKLARESPEILSAWRELSRHPEGSVRFRVACFLNDLPATLASELGAELASDRNKKVRDMAIARLEEIASAPGAAQDQREGRNS